MLILQFTDFLIYTKVEAIPKLRPCLNDIFKPEIAICHILGPDLGGIWESKHKVSTNCQGIPKVCFCLLKTAKIAQN